MSGYINFAKSTIEKEILGLNTLLTNLPSDFEKAAKAIISNKGRLVVSGIGKSGYIGQKISASLASTGTRSFYIHPAEASHGDLGMISDEDIVMLLSNSGETKELLDIISYCKRFSIPIIGITMQTSSVLAKSSTYLLNIPHAEEASSVNAPTTSSTMMLVLGDALTVAVHSMKGFTKDDYAIFHPGGKLGASLLKVSDLMHKNDQVPQVYVTDLMDKAIIEMTSKGFGCTAVINDKKKIVGIITDGDLRRHMGPNLISLRVDTIMSYSPLTIKPTNFAAEALAIMSKQNITTLLVSEHQTIVGILHVHDLLRSGVK